MSIVFLKSKQHDSNNLQLKKAGRERIEYA